MPDIDTKNQDRGINMHVVTEVQHIVILAEHHLLDYKGVEKRFSQIQPLRYPRWLVALMVGLSCACFCKLNKGGWDGAVITFFASTVAMYIRQLLAQRHLHPQINFLPHRFRRHHHFRFAFATSHFQQYTHYRDGRQRSAAGAGFSVD